MNRDELCDAILELADSPHMRQHTLEMAFSELSLEALGRVFDQVADHYDLLHPRGRRRVPRNPVLG